MIPLWTLKLKWIHITAIYYIEKQNFKVKRWIKIFLLSYINCTYHIDQSQWFTDFCFSRKIEECCSLITYWLTDLQTDSMPHKLTDRVIDALVTDSASDCSTKWLTDLQNLTDWLTESLVLPYWLTGWLTSWLTVTLNDSLTNKLTHWLTYWLSYWLTICYLAHWWTCWLAH